MLILPAPLKNTPAVCPHPASQIQRLQARLSADPIDKRSAAHFESAVKETRLKRADYSALRLVNGNN
jgi:hypothetical protein